MKVRDISSFFNKSPKATADTAAASSSTNQVVQVPSRLSRRKGAGAPEPASSATASTAKSPKTTGKDESSSQKGRKKDVKPEPIDDEDPIPKTTVNKSKPDSKKSEQTPPSKKTVVPPSDSEEDEPVKPSSRNSSRRQTSASPSKSSPVSSKRVSRGRRIIESDDDDDEEEPIPSAISKKSAGKPEAKAQSKTPEKKPSKEPPSSKNTKSPPKSSPIKSKNDSRTKDKKRKNEESDIEDDDEEDPIPKNVSKKPKSSSSTVEKVDTRKMKTPEKKPATAVKVVDEPPAKLNGNKKSFERNPPPKLAKTSKTTGKSTEKMEIDDEDPIPKTPQQQHSKAKAKTPSSTKGSNAKKEAKATEPKLELKTPEEKRRLQQSNYMKMMSRGGPKHLGSKEVPVGAEDCLKGLTFVQTGVLDSFEHDDIKNIIEKYGGRMTSAVSRKTDYLLLGDEPGETKRKKAKELKVPIMSEDEFLDLIKKSNPDAQPQSQTVFGIQDDDDEAMDIGDEGEVKAEPAAEETRTTSSRQSPKKRQTTPVTSPRKELKPEVDEKLSKASASITRTSPAKAAEKLKSSPLKTELADTSKSSPVKVKAEESKSNSQSSEPSSSDGASSSSATTSFSQILTPAACEMWVDKYRPKTMKQLVGQANDKSVANRLVKWLQNWFNYHGQSADKAKTNYPGLKDPEGKTFKAALLSGPPGIGKTTMAHLVCEQIGLDYIELNASDQRNKKGIHEVLSDLISSKTLFDVGNKNHDIGHMARKHVLIMDEVDGMSGNEDRGGIQELIALIKTSRIPIICICNDRNHQKIRSLANYCFDLRCNKPTIEQLKGFIQSICFKEKMKIPYECVLNLVKSTDFDIRQIINQLQLLKETSPDDNVLYNPRKDLSFGNWEVCRKVFSAAEHVGMSIQDKNNLFFQDYSFGPLFVHENYLRSKPIEAKGDKFKTLDLVHSAAEAIATGDLVDNLIRRSMNWSLLPTQAIFSSILPGEYMQGNESSGMEFPKWLGQNSHRNKMSRLLQQLHTHVHLQVSGSLEALNLDYLPYMRRSIVNPLVRGDVEDSVGVMQNYNLLREDLDNINELTMWPGMRNPLENLDSKTKAAFTRQVNKEILPYSIVKPTKGKGKTAASAEDELEGLEGEETAQVGEDEEEEEENPETDAMIKMKKKKPAKAKAKATSSEPSTSKGKSSSAAAAGKKKKPTYIDDDDDEDEDEDDSDDEDVKPAKKSSIKRKKDEEPQGSKAKRSRK